MTTAPQTGAAYSVRLITAVNAAMRSAVSVVGGNLSGSPLGALDDKRGAAWAEYGWPDDLQFDNFKHLYDRQGYAYGTVNLLAGKCWEDSPRIVQGEPAETAQPATAWEKSVKALLRKARFWKAYAEADVMRVVGGWSAILLQMADDSAQSQWDQPVSGKPVIIRATAAWAGQLKPTVTADGTVQFWGYTENVDTTGDGAVSPRNLKIHPDRIILVGDWRTGVSMLRSPYNAFVNLEKISGGSGESFLKNAARQVHLNFDKDANLNDIAAAYGVKTEDLQDVFNETARRMNRGNDLVLATQGATAVPLVATVPDPKPHAELNLQEIAASFRMPVKVIVGMQTGERASSEDLKDFNRRGQGRRIHVLSFDIEDAVDHLLRIGALPAAANDGFHIYWTDLTQASGAEKLENAMKMAEINAKTAGTGEAAPFSSDEIREAAGKEARTDSQGGGAPSESLTDDELAAARMAQAERAARQAA